ncbi:MAG TPA: ATP-binding cassette domain-containing protein [Methanoregulaceae archaeon]|nr:ATP-binding cassette domain-containing protein [Methanoregulaceae archaeon]
MTVESERDGPANDQEPGRGGAPEVVRIEHLSRVFGHGSGAVTALDDVSFSIRRGEIFGLLGPNGAGKSTLIRILTTLLAPTSGTARVGGFDLSREPERIRSVIGVCPQASTLDLELSAWDNLAFYGHLVGYPEKGLNDRIRELLASAGLEDRARSRVSTFSGGMRRRLEIVRAFIHRPQVIFLDEPTIGLDPEARHEVWEQIERLNAEETTVVLTTHYMDEAEHLCDRIAFIDGGRLIALDSVRNLRGLVPSGDVIEVGVEEVPEEMLERLRAHPRVEAVERRDRTLAIRAADGARLVPALLQVLDEAGLRVVSLSIRSPSLEDLFIYLTGKGLGARTGPPARGAKTGRRP